jgi:stearoyl-CoA desaturase (delta-9 desaturase)
MKLKAFHSFTLLKSVQQVNFWGTLPSLVVLACVGSAWHWLAALVAVFCISKVGHSIGQHRYYSHKAFKTGPLRSWFIGLCSTLSTTGSAIHYSSVHRHHHLTSDTEDDLHDPKRLGFFRTFFLFMPPGSLEKIRKGIIKDLLRDRWAVWFHNWYWPVIAAYVLTLALVDPLLVLFCYVIPGGYSRFISGVQLTFVHGHGYRNFETSDNSTNSLFWNWVTLGEGLHNNHHARPGEARFDFTKKPREFDFAGFVIDKLFRLREPHHR